MSYHLPRLYAPIWYVGSLSLGTGPRLLLELVLDAKRAHREVQLDQVTWGKLLHRSPRTIRRWLRELRARHLVRVIRRGRRLTNLYMLGRSLWARLTGQHEARAPSGHQRALWGVFERIEQRAPSLNDGRHRQWRAG